MRLCALSLLLLPACSSSLSCNFSSSSSEEVKPPIDGGDAIEGESASGELEISRDGHSDASHGIVRNMDGIALYFGQAEQLQRECEGRPFTFRFRQHGDSHVYSCDDRVGYALENDLPVEVSMGLESGMPVYVFRECTTAEATLIINEGRTYAYLNCPDGRTAAYNAATYYFITSVE